MQDFFRFFLEVTTSQSPKNVAVGSVNKSNLLQNKGPSVTRLERYAWAKRRRDSPKDSRSEAGTGRQSSNFVHFARPTHLIAMIKAAQLPTTPAIS
jgi:hypothetical protein